MGYKEDILKFTERYNDVWPFFKRYYRPSNVSIVLVGDLDFDKSLAVIRKKFGPWKNPEIAPVNIPDEAEQTEMRAAEVKLAKPTQTRLTVSYKIPAFTTKDANAESLQVLAEMLFSVTSDFQKEFRFEKKWLDSVSGGVQESVDPGLWTIGLRLSEAGEGKESELVAAVEKTIAGARASPPTAERLAATKKRFRNAAVTSWFASPEALADRIAWYTNFEPDVDVLNRIFERLEQVTPQGLNDFAKTFLVDARKTTITLHGSK
jgi:predicted Zn-dependent peptidase